MIRNIFAILLVGFLVISCAGKDPNEVDTTPPAKPNLFTHIGDTGDIQETVIGDSIIIDTLNFYKKENSVIHMDSERENNGIDAVDSSNNQIQIQWVHPTDTADLAYIHIYCFNLSDSDTLKIYDQIPDQDFFLDDFSKFTGPSTDKSWFYFIEFFDEAGNSSVSDTVGYHLLDKPTLESPLDNAQYDSEDNIDFQWKKAESLSIAYYRILLFDADRNLIWLNEPLDSEGDSFIVFYGDDLEEENLSSGNYFWRVDAFGVEGGEEVIVNGSTYLIKAGSESIERTIVIE